MPIWQDANGNLHDDMDGAARGLLDWPPGMTKLTAAQAAALQNPAPTPAQAWTAYQDSAKAALAATDKTVVRVQEAIVLGTTTTGAPDVVAFMHYRKSLRAILSQDQPATIPAALPSAPPFPAGT